MRNHNLNEYIIPSTYYSSKCILGASRSTVFMKDGMLGEAPFTNACYLLGIPCDHNPYDERYADNASINERKRLDHIIVRDFPKERLRLIIADEDKNHKKGSSWWTKDFLDREVISRFDSDPRIKELIEDAEDKGFRVRVKKYLTCSFFNGSNKMREYLQNDGWKIIEFGYKITRKNFGKAVNFMYRKLYWLKDYFRQYIITSIDNSISRPVYSIESYFGRFVRDLKDSGKDRLNNKSNGMILSYFKGFG